MGLGMGLMRYSPDGFWRMTLREFSAAVRVMFPSDDAIDRTRLDQLMKRYPDQ